MNTRESGVNDDWVNAHPVYGPLRKLRYQENFLYSYEEIDKMFGLLFMNNQQNRMALDYFMAQLLLKGNIAGFQQNMGTFLAANLAVSFALLGKKVVLCGLDIRKPALGRLFSLKDRTAGVTQLLVKDRHPRSP